MNELLLLPRAEQDLEEAIDWYTARSTEAAERFADAVDGALIAIRTSPARFPKWDDRHRFYLLRRFPYYVAYRIQAEQILIVAVRHTSRGGELTT